MEKVEVIKVFYTEVNGIKVLNDDFVKFIKRERVEKLVVISIVGVAGRGKSTVGSILVSGIEKRNNLNYHNNFVFESSSGLKSKTRDVECFSRIIKLPGSRNTGIIFLDVQGLDTINDIDNNDDNEEEKDELIIEREKKNKLNLVKNLYISMISSSIVMFLIEIRQKENEMTYLRSFSKYLKDIKEAKYAKYHSPSIIILKNRVETHHMPFEEAEKKNYRSVAGDNIHFCSFPEYNEMSSEIDDKMLEFFTPCLNDLIEIFKTNPLRLDKYEISSEAFIKMIEDVIAELNKVNKLEELKFISNSNNDVLIEKLKFDYRKIKNYFYDLIENFEYNHQIFSEDPKIQIEALLTKNRSLDELPEIADTRIYKIYCYRLKNKINLRKEKALKKLELRKGNNEKSLQESSINQINREIKNFRELFKKEEGNNFHHNARIIANKKTIEQLEEEIERNFKKKEETNASLEKKRMEYEKNKDRIELYREMEKLKLDSTNLDSQINSCRDNISDLERKSKINNIDKNSLQIKLERLNSKSDLISRLNHKETELEDLKIDHTRIKRKFEEKKKDFDEETKKLEDSKRKLSDLKIKNDTNLKELNIKNKEIKIWENKKTILSNQLKRKTDDNSSKEIRALEKEKCKISRKIKRRKPEKEELKTEYEQMEENYRILQDYMKYENYINNFKDEIKDRKGNLNLNFDEIEDGVINIKNEQDHIKNEIKKLEEKLKKIENEKYNPYLKILEEINLIHLENVRVEKFLLQPDKNELKSNRNSELISLEEKKKKNNKKIEELDKILKDNEEKLSHLKSEIIDNSLISKKTLIEEEIKNNNILSKIRRKSKEILNIQLALKRDANKKANDLINNLLSFINQFEKIFNKKSNSSSVTKFTNFLFKFLNLDYETIDNELNNLNQEIKNMHYDFSSILPKSKEVVNIISNLDNNLDLNDEYIQEILQKAGLDSKKFISLAKEINQIEQEEDQIRILIDTKPFISDFAKVPENFIYLFKYNWVNQIKENKVKELFENLEKNSEKLILATPKEKSDYEYAIFDVLEILTSSNHKIINKLLKHEKFVKLLNSLYISSEGIFKSYFNKFSKMFGIDLPLSIKFNEQKFINYEILDFLNCETLLCGAVPLFFTSEKSMFSNMISAKTEIINAQFETNFQFDYKILISQFRLLNYMERDLMLFNINQDPTPNLLDKILLAFDILFFFLQPDKMQKFQEFYEEQLIYLKDKFFVCVIVYDKNNIPDSEIIKKINKKSKDERVNNILILTPNYDFNFKDNYLKIYYCKFKNIFEKIINKSTEDRIKSIVMLLYSMTDEKEEDFIKYFNYLSNAINEKFQLLKTKGQTIKLMEISKCGIPELESLYEKEKNTEYKYTFLFKLLDNLKINKEKEAFKILIKPVEDFVENQLKSSHQGLFIILKDYLDLVSASNYSSIRAIISSLTKVDSKYNFLNLQKILNELYYMIHFCDSYGKDITFCDKYIHKAFNLIIENNEVFDVIDSVNWNFLIKYNNNNFKLDFNLNNVLCLVGDYSFLTSFYEQIFYVDIKNSLKIDSILTGFIINFKKDLKLLLINYNPENTNMINQDRNEKMFKFLPLISDSVIVLRSKNYIESDKKNLFIVEDTEPNILKHLIYKLSFFKEEKNFTTFKNWIDNSYISFCDIFYDSLLSKLELKNKCMIDMKSNFDDFQKKIENEISSKVDAMIEEYIIAVKSNRYKKIEDFIKYIKNVYNKLINLKKNEIKTFFKSLDENVFNSKEKLVIKTEDEEIKLTLNEYKINIKNQINSLLFISQINLLNKFPSDLENILENECASFQTAVQSKKNHTKDSFLKEYETKLENLFSQISSLFDYQFYYVSLLSKVFNRESLLVDKKMINLLIQNEMAKELSDNFDKEIYKTSVQNLLNNYSFLKVCLQINNQNETKFNDNYFNNNIFIKESNESKITLDSIVVKTDMILQDLKRIIQEIYIPKRSVTECFNKRISKIDQCDKIINIWFKDLLEDLKLFGCKLSEKFSRDLIEEVIKLGANSVQTFPKIVNEIKTSMTINTNFNMNFNELEVAYFKYSPRETNNNFLLKSSEDQDIQWLINNLKNNSNTGKVNIEEEEKINKIFFESRKIFKLEEMIKDIDILLVKTFKSCETPGNYNSDLFIYESLSLDDYFCWFEKICQNSFSTELDKIRNMKTLNFDDEKFNLIIKECKKIMNNVKESFLYFSLDTTSNFNAFFFHNIVVKLTKISKYSFIQKAIIRIDNIFSKMKNPLLEQITSINNNNTNEIDINSTKIIFDSMMKEINKQLYLKLKSEFSKSVEEESLKIFSNFNKFNDQILNIENQIINDSELTSDDRKIYSIYLFLDNYDFSDSRKFKELTNFIGDEKKRLNDRFSEMSSQYFEKMKSVINKLKLKLSITNNLQHLELSSSQEGIRGNESKEKKMFNFLFQFLKENVIIETVDESDKQIEFIVKNNECSIDGYIFDTEIFYHTFQNLISSYKNNFTEDIFDDKIVKDSIITNYFGCSSKCPCCGKKCELIHDSKRMSAKSITHEAKFHNMRIFKGYKTNNNQPSLITCDELTGNSIVQIKDIKKTWNEHKAELIKQEKWSFKKTTSEKEIMQRKNLQKKICDQFNQDLANIFYKNNSGRRLLQIDYSSFVNNLQTSHFIIVVNQKSNLKSFINNIVNSNIQNNYFFENKVKFSICLYSEDVYDSNIKEHSKIIYQNSKFDLNMLKNSTEYKDKKVPSAHSNKTTLTNTLNNLLNFSDFNNTIVILFHDSDKEIEINLKIDSKNISSIRFILTYSLSISAKCQKKLENLSTKLEGKSLATSIKTNVFLEDEITLIEEVIET